MCVRDLTAHKFVYEVWFRDRTAHQFVYEVGGVSGIAQHTSLSMRSGVHQGSHSTQAVMRSGVYISGIS